MAPKAQQIAEMVNMLPERDQQLAYDLVKKLVLAWDPDFTKMTAQEKAELDLAQSNEYISGNDIDWN